MELSRKETYRNQKVSLGVTLLSFLVMLGFFIFTNVISANATNFVASPQIVLSMDEGTAENSVIPGDQAVTGLLNEISSTKIQTADASIPVENGISELITKYKTAHFESSSPVSSDLEKPSTLVEGETKNGLMPGPQISNPAMVYSLGDRRILQRPALTTGTQDQGTVVVDITVDKTGKVIDANPNGRGTTTSNSALKSDAAKIAFATKFNADQKFEEQRGTITIIFSFD